MRGGHYIAYTCYTIEGKRHWQYASDNVIQKCSEEAALEAEAYILFYRRTS
jgi:ubiquitin C-terminal hydrolase